jgi:hypothetical protein
MTVNELHTELSRLIDRKRGNDNIAFAKDEDTYDIDYVNSDTGGPLVLLVRD